MKTLFLQSYYYVLAAFLCAGSVCLAADAIAPEAAPTNNPLPLVVPKPSAEEQQKRDAEKAVILSERHKKTAEKLAELEAKAAPMIQKLKEAKKLVEEQSAAAAQISSQVSAVAPLVPAAAKV